MCKLQVSTPLSGRRTGRGAVLLAVLALAGCVDESQTPTFQADPATTVAEVQNDSMRGEFPAVRRVELDIQARGAFRPGAPIVITANALARLAATDAQLDLVLLDAPGESARVRRPAGRGLGAWRGDLAAGGRRQLGATVTFDRPGYYRIGVRAVSRPGAAEDANGAMVLGTSFETLYVLVDENGGRLTQGYDPAVAAARAPQFGSYGPFQDAAAPAAPATADLNVSALSAAVTGRLVYWNVDVSDRTAVPGAEVQVTCKNLNGSTHSYVTARTDADGYFSFYCPENRFDGTAYLRDAYTFVNGHGGADIRIYFSEANGGAPVLEVGNFYAAHVFRMMTEMAPRAVGLFQRSIGETQWRVSDYDPNYDIYFGTSDLRIRMNYTRVFGEEGWFVATHEYGHAYQWRAIDEWGEYSCTDGSHGYDELENRSCAYVEGFANFFANYVAGARLGSDYRAYGGDYRMEENPYRTYGDGARIEAAVGAFLYDFVDGDSEPDNYDNSVGAPEWFDNVSYPASVLGKVMATCGVYTASLNYIDRLGGIDQLVYCLEQNLAARSAVPSAYQSTWRAYYRLRYEDPVPWPAGYDANAVRTLWRYNLYNVL